MQIIDNFLSKKDYDWCIENKERIVPSGLTDWKDGYDKWNTWKNISDTEPINEAEDLSIKLISELKENYEIDFSNCSGYEYWTALRTKGDNFGWHINQKNERKLYPKEVSDELMFTLCYYIEYSESCGHLVLSNKKRSDLEDLRSSPKGQYINSEIEELDMKIEKINAVSNRLVIFDGSCLHRVEDIKGDRYTITCDFYKRKIC